MSQFFTIFLTFLHNRHTRVGLRMCVSAAAGRCVSGHDTSATWAARRRPQLMSGDWPSRLGVRSRHSVLLCGGNDAARIFLRGTNLKDHFTVIKKHPDRMKNIMIKLKLDQATPGYATKNEKSAKHGFTPGLISLQPRVGSTWAWHQCVENWLGWRIQCRLVTGAWHVRC